MRATAALVLLATVAIAQADDRADEPEDDAVKAADEPEDNAVTAADELENDAFRAADAHRCKRVRKDLDELAKLDRDRHDSMLADPAIAKCVRTPAVAPDSSVPPAAKTGHSCGFPLNLQSSLLLGGAEAPNRGAPENLLARFALQARIRRCLANKVARDVRVGVVFETGSPGADTRYYGFGIEGQVAWRGAGGALYGPRVSIVELNDEHRAYWIGARVVAGTVQLGFDLVYASPRNSTITREARGAYFVFGLDGQAGAATSVLAGAIAGLIFLAAASAYPR